MLESIVRWYTKTTLNSLVPLLPVIARVVNHKSLISFFSADRSMTISAET